MDISRIGLQRDRNIWREADVLQAMQNLRRVAALAHGAGLVVREPAVAGASLTDMNIDSEQGNLRSLRDGPSDAAAM